MVFKLIALSALMLTTAALFAQGKFSVQLGIGAGQSSANVNLDYNNYHMANYDNIGSYYLYGGIGYQIRRWRLSTGIEFFRTGFNKGFAYSNDQFGFYERIMVHGENMAIPLLLSYKIPIIKNLNIAPAAGATIIYTPGTHHYTSDHITLSIDPWDGLFATRKITPGAIAKIFAEVGIGKKLAVFAGPSLRYFKPNPSLQYYLYLFEGGLVRNF